MKSRMIYRWGIIGVFIGVVVGIGACGSVGLSGGSGDNQGDGASSGPELWAIEETTALTRGNNVYLIGTWRDLEFLSANFGEAGAPADAEYRLTDDIRFPSRSNVPSGKESESYAKSAGFQSIGTIERQFTGTFDGDGHAIIDLVINRPDEDEVGLFSGADGATFRNVHLRSVSITGGSIVGGLAGFDDDVTIEKSSVSGDVFGRDAVGGLVGMNIGTTTIKESFVNGDVFGHVQVGGLIGITNGDVTIEKSYVSGTVSGHAQVGGLIGITNGDVTIEKSYVNAAVTGEWEVVGGLIGWNAIVMGTTISNVYGKEQTFVNEDRNTVNVPAIGNGGVVAGITLLSEIDLLGTDKENLQAQFAGFDFTGERNTNPAIDPTWVFRGDAVWPVLFWQTETE